jgi:uncharacterized protein YcbX
VSAVGRVVSVHVYPVKAMRGVSVAERKVDPCGLDGDRRWMVVDPGGRFHTQRDLPALATVVAEPTADGLRLSTADRSVLVPMPLAGAGARPLEVVVWRSTVPALVASAEAAAFLEAVCQRPCQLVYMGDPRARATNPDHSREDDRVSFADGYPISLASTASFADLLTRLPEPIELERFRPNLVVEGFPPYDEDRWKRIRIGASDFRVAKAIDRCVVTTLDPRTGEAGRGALTGQPLRALAGYRRKDQSVYFAAHLIPDDPARTAPIAVGDEVTILDASEDGFLTS